MIIGDLIQTLDAIDIADGEKEPAKGDIGFIKLVRNESGFVPRCEIYFPWIQKSFWLFKEEFEILS